MRVKLFVRTATKFRDFEAVIVPKEIEEREFIRRKLSDSYQFTNNKIKNTFMYVVINLKQTVFAGAWLDISSLVKDMYIDESYRVRNRSSQIKTEYLAFVGFLFPKDTKKFFKVSNLDFVFAFNEVIEKIWDRDADENYVPEEAWFNIDECEKINNKQILKILQQNNGFISDNSPSIDNFNDVLNCMLHYDIKIQTSYCSNFINKNSFSKQNKFDFGSVAKKSKLPKSYVKKSVTFDKKTLDTTLNNSIIKNNLDDEYIMYRNGTNTRDNSNSFNNYSTKEIEKSKNLSQDNSRNEEDAQKNDLKDDKLVLDSKLKNDSNCHVSEGSKKLESKQEKIEVKHDYIEPSKNYSKSYINKQERPNYNKSIAKKKKKKRNFLKKFIIFITTDIRDLREVMKEDED